MNTIQCVYPPHHHNGFVATCRLWLKVMRRMDALDCVHDVTLMYYALCFVHVDHSVCHELVSVLINILTLLA